MTLRFLKDWNRYYKDKEEPSNSNHFDSKEYIKTESLSSFSSGNAWISNCLFQSTKDEYGGAILYSQQQNHLLVEKSLFFNLI